MKQLFDKIKLVGFPADQYYEEHTEKNQIYLHHTVSPGASAKGDIQWWLGTKARVATHVIVGQDGLINQCFSSKYWGHHLGVKKSVFDLFELLNKNRDLNKHSLSIEIDSLGPLNADGSSVAYGDACMQTAGIVEYENNFRGFKHYEAYTPAQLLTVKQLIQYWGKTYDISLEYNEDMWDVSKRALEGADGVWTHVSVRPDKSDCHPQPELIDMLQSLCIGV